MDAFYKRNNNKENLIIKDSYKIVGKIRKKELHLKKIRLKKINFSFLLLLFLINLINPVFSISEIKIKLISSGESGKLLSDSFIPNEMLINNESFPFTNIINAEGQEITLIWNSNFICCDGMFFINKTSLTSNTNSIIEEIDLSDLNLNANY